MRFRLLGARGEERTAWRALVERLDPRQRDIHFLPEYGEVYQRTYGFEPQLAVLEDAAGFVIQPFVKRPLNGLPFLREQGIAEPYFDVANPYGYGGPLVQAGSRPEALALYREFDRRLGDALRAARIPAEFTSLHPLLGNHELVAESGLIELVEQKDVVYVDLSLSEEELWRQTRKGHRSSIRKAMRSGVRIERVAPDAVDFDAFNRMYYATMDRKGAADRWRFPKDYFRNCQELLGPEAASFFFAWHERSPAAAFIVMHAFDIAYYHFGGSDTNFYALSPNNLLVHEVTLWAKRRGHRYLHLGGGVSASPDDPLFAFKSGFPHQTARLYTYGRVHDRETYDRLCRLKQAHETSVAGRPDESDFFPLYRR